MERATRMSATTFLIENPRLWQAIDERLDWTDDRGVAGKEEDLRKLFDYHKGTLPYSRGLIEDLVYLDYASRGGYYPKAFQVRNLWRSEDFADPAYYPMGSFDRWAKDTDWWRREVSQLMQVLGGAERELSVDTADIKLLIRCRPGHVPQVVQGGATAGLPRFAEHHALDFLTLTRALTRLGLT